MPAYTSRTLLHKDCEPLHRGSFVREAASVSWHTFVGERCLTHSRLPDASTSDLESGWVYLIVSGYPALQVPITLHNYFILFLYAS